MHFFVNGPKSKCKVPNVFHTFCIFEESLWMYFLDQHTGTQNNTKQRTAMQYSIQEHITMHNNTGMLHNTQQQQQQQQQEEQQQQQH